MLFHAAIVALALLSTVEPRSKKSDIAFSASLSTQRIFAKDEIVIFDDVQLNQGTAYDEITGIFTAKKKGIYQFHFALMAPKDGEVLAHLVKNNESIASVFSFSPDNFNIGGNSVIVKVLKGDTVLVKSGGNSLIYGDDDRYSTFSGVLVGK